MKLKSIILPSLALAAAMTSCDAVYEDLNPCPQGADFVLQFTHNMTGEDRFSADVHCPVLFLYDSEGNFVDRYNFDDDGKLSLELEEGDYHAISFGGMDCPEADFVFNQDFLTSHHYTELETYIRGTRGGESSKRLHAQHHAMEDFTVIATPEGHTKVTLDFIRNTNLIKAELAYSDGSAISPSTFNYTITADNAATDHANKVVASGEHTVYRPHDTGTDPQGMTIDVANIPTAWAEMTIGRLEEDMTATLLVTRAATGEQVAKIDLVKYFEKIMGNELSGVTLQEYLDRQSEWTISFTLDPETEKLAGLQFKINGWILNLANEGTIL